ncbi:MAG: hypothetical protein QY331_14140 [Melioribacteraceae bacterium]|nr:MAG: hypothetical protein QY331_14140 [Melioribacteraceae bacterium]
MNKLILLLTFLILACKEDPPVAPPDPPPPPTVINDTLEVSIIDVTHISIVVNVTSTKNNTKSFVELYRTENSTGYLVAEYPITITDTTIVDDNSGNDLQLNTEYSYYAVRRDTSGARKDTSSIAYAATLEATAFNYTWEEYSIGEWNSVLYDVWGSDENNVYAVGGVRVNDTSYGVIHWDGTEWSIFSQFGGGVAIHGFSANDIWSAGGAVYNFDGNEWNRVDGFTSGNQSFPLDQVLFDNRPYSSIWGTNSSNLYFGNIRGDVVHWDGAKATLVYSDNSEVNVKDLDGYSDDFIIGVGTGLVPPVLAIEFDGNEWSALSIQQIYSANTVSIITPNHVYFGGGGIFQLKSDLYSQAYSTNYYVWRIDYNHQNGVTAAVGAFDAVYLNNGIEWMDYSGQITSDKTTYTWIFMINNTIFCVGSTLNEAKIIVGKNY